MKANSEPRSLSLSYSTRSPKPKPGLPHSLLKSQIHPAKAPIVYIRNSGSFPLNRCLMPPESDVISPVEAVSKSLLDKPLNQLTEDDISQLTREDCRRYLKEKGMRRPSWNKSQAIQQVISLKTLLEMPPDSDSGTYKKLYAPRSPSTSNNHESRVSKVTASEAEISESAEVMPYSRKNLEKTDLFGDLPAHPAAAVKDSAPSRSTESTCIPARQMTIFYCGKVNVYDDVPADKAQALVHLAGSTLHVPPDSPLDGAVAAQHSVCHLQAANVKVCQDHAVALSPAVQTGGLIMSIRIQE